MAEASGEFQAASLKQPMCQLSTGGSAWVGRCAYGFPIDGSLPRKYLSPRGDMLEVRLPAREISLADATDRFRGRAAKSDRENDPLLRTEDMEQAKEVCPPLPLLRYPLVNHRNGARNGIESRFDTAFVSRERYVIARSSSARWRAYRLPLKRRFSWAP